MLEAPDDAGNAELIRVLRGEEDSVTGSDSLFIGPNDRTFVSQGVQSVLDLGAATGPLSHAIQAGVRLHYDSIERRHSEDEFLMTNGELVARRQRAPSSRPPTSKRPTRSPCTRSTRSRWGNLTLTPGARLSLIHSESEDRKTGATATPSRSR